MRPAWIPVTLFGLALCLAGPAWAGPGTSGAQVLRQPLSARTQGFAGAGSAWVRDVHALASNPAGLAGLETADVTFLHATGLEGMDTEWLAGAVPVAGLGTIAAQVLYRGAPDIDNLGADEPAVTVRDMVFGASFAREWAPGVRAGLNAKVLWLTLGPAEASALSVDLGVQADVTPDVWVVGAALRNLGTGVAYLEVEDPQPLTFAAGTAYRVLASDPHAITAMLDVEHVAPESQTLVRVGAEYRFQRQIAFRAGHEIAARRTVNGPAFGVGFLFTAGPVDFRIDFAVRPQVWQDEDFELANLLNLSAAF